MNITHLRSFYNAAKYKSISKAANELYLSQPGLSMQIKSLENCFGVLLLDRSRKGVELTEAGKIVFDYADAMLSLNDNIELSLKKLKQKHTTLEIGSCRSIGDYILPFTLYNFKQIHSDIDISVDIDSTFCIIKKVQDMTLNLGIIQESSVPNDLECKALPKDELILVASSDYEYEEISISDLYSIPIIVREKSSATRLNLENILRKNGVDIEKLNIIFSFNSPEAIKKSVILGKGLSFVPKITIKEELQTNVLKKVVVNNLDTRFNYYISYRKNHCFSKSEELFMEFMLSKQRCF